MANTYSQVLVQIVFAVKYRQRRIHPEIKEELHGFISGVINRRNHRCIIVNSMPDHIHLLVSMGPRQAISDLVREIKTTSGEWINQHDSAKPANSGKFRWQEGYAVFSYHVSQKDMVYHYILHQEKHHNTMKLSEEFRYMMKDNEVDFNPQYAGEWLMDSD